VPRSWKSFNVLSLILLPATLFFLLGSHIRRQLFRYELLKSTKIEVPVIVVGNITVGGTGKTPTVIALANALKAYGYIPGIISRGYRGDGQEQEVLANSVPSQVGDEPILISKKTLSPVWVGPSRIKAARHLLTRYPNVNVIISDDGLQHYALKRDIEVIVIDGSRKFGNGFLLPSGPLRESKKRIHECDLAVINGSERLDLSIPTINMTLVGEIFHNLSNPDRTCNVSDLCRREVAAIAGIGNPERFFLHLESLGLKPKTHSFPDHHEYSISDITSIEQDIILMTEKDAVKCPIASGKECWFLPVHAEFNADLITNIIEKLKTYRG
jgi:tetraacyldisaccharide 4'-kinase